jgi:hypothetical protein
MSQPIGPGDWVECVNRTSQWGGLLGGCDRLRVGALYQVVAVDRNPDDPAVLLAEARSDHVSGMFSASHFRPVYRPKSDFIEKLKQPAPAREHETV